MFTRHPRSTARRAWCLASLCGILLTVLLPHAHANTFGAQTPAGYTSRIDGAQNEEVYDSCTDASGNVYVCGRFTSHSATVDVVKSNSNSNPTFDRTASTALLGGDGTQYYLFVTKYDRDGNVVWARSAGTTTNPYNSAGTVATGIAADANGNVFVTGSIGGLTNFGTYTIDTNLGVTYNTSATTQAQASQDGTNIFVAMLSANGIWQWIKPLAANFYETDYDGKTIYGLYSAPYPWFRNGGPLNSSGQGTVRPQGPVDGHALALGPDGSVYVKGYMELNDNNVGLAMHSVANRVAWMRLSGSGVTSSNRVALAATSATGAAYTMYNNTAFVAKLTAVPAPLGSAAGTAANYVWSWITPVVSGAPPSSTGNVTLPVVTWDAANASSIGGLVADDSSVYLTGTFKYNNLLSGGTGTAPQDPIDGYVGRLNATDGSPVYLATYAGGTSTHYPLGIFYSYPGAVTIDSQGNAYITGQVRNTGTSNAGSLMCTSGTTGAKLYKDGFSVTSNQQRPFVGKLDPTGVWQWVASPDFSAATTTGTNTTTPAWGWATSLARDAAGGLYLGGSVSSAGATTGSNATQALAFNNATVPAPNSPITNVPTSTLVYGPILGGTSGTYSTAYLAKITEVDNSTQYWRWADQGTNFTIGNGLVPVGYDTGDVVAGLGGNVYWSISDLTPYGADWAGRPYQGSFFRTGSANYSPYDSVVNAGSFLLPVQMDSSYLSSTFSVLNTVPIGTAITPPQGIYYDGNNHPIQPSIFLPGTTTNASGYFYWDSYAGKLYPITPIIAEIRWHTNGNASDLTNYVSMQVTSVWGDASSQVAGAGANGDEPRVNLQPPGIAYTFQSILYQDNGSTVAGTTLRTTNNGSGTHSVLLYTTGAGSSPGSSAAVIRVLNSYSYTDARVNKIDKATIGTAIAPTRYGAADPEGKNGYIVNAATGPYDGYGPGAAYNAPTQVGSIIPVNTGKLTVIYPALTPEGVALPRQTLVFDCVWPTINQDPYQTPQIVVTSQLGSEVYGQTQLDPAKYTSLAVYNQPDRTKPGYNPNEEHALVAPSNQSTGFPAVFALRNDLNNVNNVATSDPWVLLRYQDITDGLKTKFFVYYVYVTHDQIKGLDNKSYPPYNFATFYGVAGNTVIAPYPLSLLGNASGTTGSGVPFFKDRTNQVWARSAGTLISSYFYPLQANFWYDPTGSGTASTATQAPWLDKYYAANYNNANLGFLPSGTAPAAGTPVPVNYTVYWPDDSRVPAIPSIAGQAITTLPALHVGDTLTKPAVAEQNGLFDVQDAASLSIIYDGNDIGSFDNVTGTITGLTPANDSVRLYNYNAERKVLIDARINGTSLAVNNGATTTSIPVSAAGNGRYLFPGMPYQLRLRVFFDPTPVTGSDGKTYRTLLVTGYKADINSSPAVAGRPLLLPNILSSSDQAVLTNFYQVNGVTASTVWNTTVSNLVALSRDPNGTGINGGYGVGLDVLRNAAGTPILGANSSKTVVRGTALAPNALAATTASSASTYVTLIENNATTLGALPVALHLFKTDPRPVIGEIKVLPSDNPLEERITLRHSSDFAGNNAAWDFDWYYRPAISPVAGTPGNPASPSDAAPTPADWQPLPSGNGQGLNEVTIQGSGITMLQDSDVICRYRPHGATVGSSYTYWAGQPGNTVVYPNGTAPTTTNYYSQYVPGWINRVITGINPFEQRAQSFATTPAATYASMIQQAGRRYEGPVALNNDPNYLNSIGLIELYETVLQRGLALSVNNGANNTNSSVNNELLLAATRVSDFDMVLGNEAFADSQDPTVGITTADGTYSSLAPTLYAFANQLPSLMQEELCLLRGRDNNGTTTGAAPVYNRLYWNFTSGLEGEPVYVNTYGISDQNHDGVIDATDAATLYPQGHGDAWGYYLSAIKEHYRLLRNPNYLWTPRAQTALVAGIGVEVDYYDEQKFATAAAARANAGAEIVNLTYRDSYVANPAGEWQGYTDTNTARAWGVDDWARRAGQGAYLDWVTANAILPAVQTNLLPPNQATAATGLSKIDRTTVTQLATVASDYTKIQGKMDQADQGLNPLGLSPGAIPFDIDPSFLIVGSTIQGNTHFEQIMNRATAATNSALQVFNYANSLSQRLRQVQLTSDQFSAQAQQQEFDYKNQLIAIFGYPYAGDVGPTGTYPTGYDGPDLYHYNYVAVNDVTGSTFQPDQSFNSFFLPIGQQFTAQNSGGGAATTGSFTQVVSHFFSGDVIENAVTAKQALQVPFPISTAADWTFVAPAAWGARRAPGSLQMAINDMVTAEANLRRGAINYRNQIAQIQDLIDLLHALSGIQADEINVLDNQYNQIKNLNDEIVKNQNVILGLDTASQVLRDATDAIIEGFPKEEGLAFDAFFASRAVLKGAGYAAADVLSIASAAEQGKVNAAQADQTNIANEAQVKIQKDEFAYEIQQQLKDIEANLRQLVGLRVDLFTLAQTLSQAVGNYQQQVAQGLQLLQAREMYRRNVAGAVQLNRYQDLTFRIFRNDALQKYAAAFDLAARYTYLAATAYDYETCLLGTNTTAGQRFLTDIVGERSLGQFGTDGSPVVGAAGLSDPQARLSQNFAVLKGQLGINNPQFENGGFSLRSELFRILPTVDGGADADATWRAKLQSLRVDNLWSVPEFRRYCKPFAPESAGAQPGLVIPFNSDITFGYNFFHQELAGGDSSYDSSRFSTKINSIGVFFTNYDGKGLAVTPRVYLVPAGTDVLRTPNGADLTTREFDVVDQAIPTPFPVGNSDLTNPSWIPQNNDLNGPLGAIRQLARFPAYGDSQTTPDNVAGDTTLIGRSVWNTRWMLIIPGGTFLNNGTTGLDTFISGQAVPGTTTGARDGNGVSDIRLLFKTYSYSGN